MPTYPTVISRRWYRSLVLVVALVLPATGVATAGANSALPGSYRLLSARADGSQTHGSAQLDDMTPDGHYVVMEVQDGNIVPGDEPYRGVEQVIRLDRESGETVRVSHGRNGEPVAGGTADAHLSADGRYVVFSSYGDNLARKCRRGCVFHYDVSTGRTKTVSTTADGGATTGNPGGISADGRFVTFQSYSDEIIPEGDGKHASDIFLRDMRKNKTTLVSRGHIVGRSYNDYPTITPDGQKILYSSTDNTLTDPPSDDWYRELVLFDRKTGENTYLPASDIANDAPSITADGSEVAFVSYDSLVVGAPEDIALLYVLDLTSGEVRWIDHRTDGDPSHGYPYSPRITSNGSLVSFKSTAYDLVPNDDNEAADVFVADLATGDIRAISVNPDGATANAESYRLISTDDGSVMTINSIATDIVAEQVAHRPAVIEYRAD